MSFYYINYQKNNLLKVGFVLKEEQKAQDLIQVISNFPETYEPPQNSR